MRVLIVDDNCNTADMLQMLLRAAGHDVRTAYRGYDAIALAAVFDPQLAILDIQLPDTTGFVVARTLRQRVGRRLHIVAITGEDRALGLTGNFDQHAYKPVTAARLYQILDVAREALSDID